MNCGNIKAGRARCRATSSSSQSKALGGVLESSGMSCAPAAAIEGHAAKH